MSTPPIERRKRTVFPTMEIDNPKIKRFKRSTEKESTLIGDTRKVKDVVLSVKIPEDFAKEKSIERTIAHKKTNECIAKAIERFKEIAKKGIDKYV